MRKDWAHHAEWPTAIDDEVLNRGRLDRLIDGIQHARLIGRWHLTCNHAEVLAVCWVQTTIDVLKNDFEAGGVHAPFGGRHAGGCKLLFVGRLLLYGESYLETCNDLGSD